MSLSQLLSHWRAEPTIGGNIVDWRTIPAREAQFVSFPDELHPSLREALNERNYPALYHHQAAAWEHARAGNNVALVTGTASGDDSSSTILKRL